MVAKWLNRCYRCRHHQLHTIHFLCSIDVTSALHSGQKAIHECKASETSCACQAIERRNETCNWRQKSVMLQLIRLRKCLSINYLALYNCGWSQRALCIDLPLLFIAFHSIILHGDNCWTKLAIAVTIGKGYQNSIRDHSKRSEWHNFNFTHCRFVKSTYINNIVEYIAVLYRTIGGWQRVNASKMQ